MLCHPHIPTLHGVLENQRLSTFRMDPSLKATSWGNLPHKAASPKPNAAQRAKGNSNFLMAKPEKGRGKRGQKHWSFIFKQSGWIKQENIAQPEFDFQAWLGFFFCLFGVCCCWGFSVGFVLWLLFLTVFNLSDPGLRKTKNPLHVLKDFGCFICSSFSIFLLSLYG